MQPDGKITNGITSFQTSQQRSYLIKILTGRLPTATWKKLYNPQYPSTTCLFCNKTETTKHLFDCLANREEFSTLAAELMEKIPTSLNKKEVEYSLTEASTTRTKAHGSRIVLSGQHLASGFVPKTWTLESEDIEKSEKDAIKFSNLFVTTYKEYI